VSASYRTRSGGRVGRSWGCPALDPAVARAIIDRIQDRSVIYAGDASKLADAVPPIATLVRADVSVLPPPRAASCR